MCLALEHKTLPERMNLKALDPESNVLTTRSRGKKTFFMLNLTETKIYPANKC